MKKTELINPALSQLIARLGQSDMLVVADAGLPIPASTQRIDLALIKGVPTFIETLKVILSEMYVEKAIVAEEIIKKIRFYMSNSKSCLDRRLWN